ncbi:hypothetical protein K2173_006062 [Erythroxylum novogranatense]|uniref:Protein kinase domain-containing protein n=1 Tax=Erythroxylum novogranatense TaxID=1862640 RepID=A0AAV8TBS2_9ROSI|nr:hypothetical protein K2173_006062 [Erythroxylum novogranatense]
MKLYNLLPEAPATLMDYTASFPPPVSHDTSHPGHLQVAEILVSIVVLVLVASLCLYFRNRLTRLCRNRWTVKGNLKADEELPLKRFRFEDLQKATKNFGTECLIGTGAFGNVYKGTFEVEGTLAIKKAHSDSYQSLEEFRNEVRLLAKVKHKNLVGLVGFCEESGVNGGKILVYEYAPNGSLLDYLTGRGGRTLAWRQRVYIAVGTAKGIAHLHEGLKPGIIHRDIKPSNILVGEGFEAKVSDFGLVKMGPTEDKSHVSTQIKGTPGYLDPAYFSSFHLTPFSDVYSFGVILLQLVTARPAVDTSQNRTDHIIDWLLVEPCNMGVMLKMGQLGLRCVVRNPKDRPTMTEVWKELEAALLSADDDSFFINSKDSCFGPSTEDYSQSIVSIDGVGLQRFHIDFDSISISFETPPLRCFETSTVIFENSDKKEEAEIQLSS